MFCFRIVWYSRCVLRIYLYATQHLFIYLHIFCTKITTFGEGSYCIMLAMHFYKANNRANVLSILKIHVYACFTPPPTTTTTLPPPSPLAINDPRINRSGWNYMVFMNILTFNYINHIIMQAVYVGSVWFARSPLLPGAGLTYITVHLTKLQKVQKAAHKIQKCVNRPCDACQE